MRASLDTTSLELVPGQPARITVEITNSLEVIDGVTVSLDAGEGCGVVVSPQILPLFPDGVGTVMVTLTASPTFPAGTHEALVEVRSSVHPEEVVQLPLTLEVAPAPEASLKVLPAVRIGRSRGQYAVLFDNTGNTPLELSLAASDPERALVPEFSPPLITVAPGTTASVELALSTRRKWFAAEIRRPVHVLATDSDLELTGTASFVQTPVIPRGVRTALVLATIVALWAVVFIFALDRALAKDPLTKQVPASFYAPVASSANSSALSADVVGLTGANSGDAPAGAVPKSGVVIGVGGTINGTVTARSTGAGIGRITVEAVRDSRDGPVLVSSAATDANGNYSLVGLLPGDYKLLYSASGYQSVWWPDATSEPTAHPIEVDALLQTSGVDAIITGNNGSISGTVDTGQTPPAPVTITVQPEQGGTAPIGTFQTDASGNYTIPNLPAPGTYDLSFTSPGYLVASDVETINGGENHTANTVTLSAANGTIGGTVTDGTNPLGGVTITAANNGQTITSATPTTGTVGQFTIPNLTTPATYLLTLSKTGYGTQTVAVSLGPGQSQTNLNIALSGGAGQVSGTVTDSSGNGLGGVSVTVNGASGTVTTQTLTAGTVGAYLLSGLATPGSYTVTFTLPGYISQTVAVNLTSSGSAAGVNAVLPSGVGVVTGTVTSSTTSLPLSGVTVSLTDGTAVKTTQTSSSPPGGYTVSGLTPASYSVTFSLPGYQSQTALVQVTPAGTVTQPIALVPDS